jgi:hypothetical protein
MGGWVGQNQPGCFEEVNPITYWSLNPGLSSPYPNHYADYTIPAPMYQNIVNNYSSHLYTLVLQKKKAVGTA